MAELMFKRGAQASLNDIIEQKKAIDGCFYLTEDTHRLYVGQGDNTAPVLLNQTVQVVQRLEDLPKSPPAADNDFYYIKNLNILAVYDSKATTEDKWVQINPDTDTNDIVQVDNIDFAKTSASDNEVIYTLTLKQKKYDINENEVDAPDDLTATLTLKSEDIANIVPEAAQVGLKTQDSSSGVIISTAGEGSSTQSVIKLVPGANIDDISADTKGNITIDSHNNVYAINVASEESGVKLVLADETDEDDTEVIVNGGADISISGDGTKGTITVAHASYDTKSASVTNEAALDPEDTLQIISGITLNNGHITNIATSNIKMPFDSHLVDGVAHDAESWIATLTDNNENSWEIDFSEDATALKTELTTYIDQGLAAANTALVYKGTISHPSVLDTKSNVEVGDVYLLSADTTVGNVEYRQGDIFIAVSKTGASGLLESDDLEWTYIPSGNEMVIDTHFKGVANVSGKAGVTDSTNNGSAKFHIEAKTTANGDDNTPEDNETLQIIAGQDLEIVNNTASGSKEKIATVRHKTFTTKTEEQSSDADTFEVEAIVGITEDNGHITQIDTKKFSLATYELSGSDNQIILSDSAENDRGIIKVEDDKTWISASVANDILTVKHNNPSNTKYSVVATNQSTNLVQEGALNIISGVYYDDKGHITQVDIEELTLPEDTTYRYYIGDGNEEIDSSDYIENPYLVLEDRNNNSWSAQMYSDNDSLEIKGNNQQVKFNLVWGSF